MSIPRSTRKLRCLRRKTTLKQRFSGIKSDCSPTNSGASSSLINSECSAANRLSKVRILKDGEAASIKYFTNGQGQQVFKSEPKPDQYLPSATELGTGFIAWLKTNFGWLYAQAQTDASLGSAYLYADGQLPSWAVLGEYDNGSASGTGRTEYMWLPTEDGSAVPVGMFRNSKFFAIHSDHLGTPRLMTDSLNKPVWQWPYSAFGNNKPTGILKPTTSATGAFTNQPNLLATQNPAAVLDLRFPGQMADEETGLFYNYFRTYQPNQGRYTQNDPIGLSGGLNRYAYVDGSPLMFTDPEGLRNARQQRQDRREDARQAGNEAQRVENYYRQNAERDAWIKNFTRNNQEYGNYGDGFGAVTGGGIAGRHPSVPNSLEILLDPNRRRNNDPFVPGLDTRPEYPGNICPRG